MINWENQWVVGIVSGLIVILILNLLGKLFKGVKWLFYRKGRNNFIDSLRRDKKSVELAKIMANYLGFTTIFFLVLLFHIENETFIILFFVILITCIVSYSLMINCLMEVFSKTKGKDMGNV